MSSTNYFTLVVENPDEKPVIYCGVDPAKNVLEVRLKNESPSAVTLKGGEPVADDAITASGPTMLYLYFGSLLTVDAVKNMRVSAEGWKPLRFDNPPGYWGLAPVRDGTLAAGASITITLSNIAVAAPPTSDKLTVGYDNVGGMEGDSLQKVVMSEDPPTPQLKDLRLNVGFNLDQDRVYVTPAGKDPIKNKLRFHLTNPSRDNDVVKPGTPRWPNDPVFRVSFVYGTSPGYGAIATTTEASNFDLALAALYDTQWTVKPEKQTEGPSWLLLPKSEKILGVGAAASVEFSIDNIESSLQPGLTHMYIQYSGIPGYNSGYYTLDLWKKIAPPTIVSFTSNKAKVNWGESFELKWETFGADYHYIKGIETAIDPKGTLPLTATGSSSIIEYELLCGKGSPSASESQVSRTARITINPIDVVKFQASSMAIKENDPVTIEWQVTSVKECTLALNGTIVARGASGSYTTNLHDTGVFTLSAVGIGTVTRCITVEVRPVNIRSFVREFKPDRPGDIMSPGTTTLRWEVEYATMISVYRKAGQDQHREFKLISIEPGKPGENVMRGSWSRHGYPDGESFRMDCNGKGGHSRIPSYQTPLLTAGDPMLAEAGLGVDPSNGGVAALTLTLENPQKMQEIFIGPDQKANNKLTLTVKNASSAALQLKGGPPVAEPVEGGTSLLSLTLGGLIEATQFEHLDVKLTGWTAVHFGGAFPAWVIAPNADLQLAAGGVLTITIDNVIASGSFRSGFLTVENNNFGALEDDSAQIALMVQNPPRDDKDLKINLEFSGTKDIYVTPAGAPEADSVKNSLKIVIGNPDPRNPIVPADKAWKTDPPIFNLFFVYGRAPGYWALSTELEANTIDVKPKAVPAPGWTIRPQLQGAYPRWELLPKAHAVLGTGNDSIAIFEIVNIVSRFEPGATYLYLQYGNIPGYKDGYASLLINKTVPDPHIIEFGPAVDRVFDWGETVTLHWNTRGGDYCYIDELKKEVPLNGSLDIVIGSSDPSFTLTCARGTPGKSRDPHTIKINLRVSPPLIEVFRADPPVARKNELSTITWKVRSVSKCELKLGGRVVGSGNSGTYTVKVGEDLKFTLELSGKGTETRPLDLNFGRMRIVSFTERKIDASVAQFDFVIEFADKFEVMKWDKLIHGGWVPRSELTTRIGFRDAVTDSKPRTKYILKATGETQSAPLYKSPDPVTAMVNDHGMTLSKATNAVPLLTAAGNDGITMTVANKDGSPVIYLGSDQKNTLSLELINTSSSSIELPAGAPVDEGSIGATPAALYLVMGTTLQNDQFSALEITAEGWTARFYGGDFPSWGLFPKEAITLEPGQGITFTIANIIATGQPRPGSMTIDYYNLGALPNDSIQLPLILHNPPSGPTALEISTQFSSGSVVNITPSGEPGLANELDLSLINPSPTTPIVPEDTHWGGSPPLFYLFFVYGDQPGYGALCTRDQGAAIDVGGSTQGSDLWVAQPFMQGPIPYWELAPRSHEILGINEDATAVFPITNIITSLQPGVTLAYLMWGNVPGYNDGYTAIEIQKAVEPPTIVSFDASVASVNWGDTFKLTWQTSGCDFCYIKEVPGAQNVDGSITLTADAAALAYTLVCGTGTPSNPIKQTSASVQIDVNPPSITSFQASATQVGHGQPVTITWETESAASCTLQQGGTVIASGTSGSTTVTVDDTTTFTLVLEGTKEVKESITIDVVQVAITNFSLSEMPLPGMMQVKLTIDWSVNYASSVVVTYDGGVIYSNSSPGCPTDSGSWSTTTDGSGGDSFQITCTGKGGPVSASTGD